MFKFKNKKNIIPKRVIVFGSSGIISKNLINALKKNKMKYKIIGRKNIDLLNDKRAHIKISKFQVIPQKKFPKVDLSTFLVTISNSFQIS